MRDDRRAGGQAGRHCGGVWKSSLTMEKKTPVPFSRP
jgi:hypothetical protein